MGPVGIDRNPPIGRPSRLELNTIVRPSGDQSGPQSLPGSFVRFLAPVPSARTTKISSSWLMPRRESRYTIHLPSGDQAGSNSGPSLRVTRTTPEPSASAVNTSSSDDSTMRPVREATSIGVPTTTGSRESIGEGSVDASEVEVDAGDPPSPSEGDVVVHDVHVAALIARSGGITIDGD